MDVHAGRPKTPYQADRDQRHLKDARGGRVQREPGQTRIEDDRAADERAPVSNSTDSHRFTLSAKGLLVCQNDARNDPILRDIEKQFNSKGIAGLVAHRQGGPAPCTNAKRPVPRRLYSRPAARAGGASACSALPMRTYSSYRRW